MNKNRQMPLDTKLKFSMAIADHVLSKLAVNDHYKLDLHSSIKEKECGCGCRTDIFSPKGKHFGCTYIGEMHYGLHA